MNKYSVSIPLSLLAALVLLSLCSTTANGQTCTGVGCNPQNTCSPVQAGGGSSRNCCCQPQCGPEGCYACLQSCYLSCAYSQCPSCDSPLCGGESPSAEGFIVSPRSIAAASDVDRVAAIVLQGRSVGGTVPIHSELVTGGTNIFGDQIGFSARIQADISYLTIDIAFNLGDSGAASLPADVRFEMDSSGAMAVSPLPADARLRIEQALAARQIPCELILAAASFLH